MELFLPIISVIVSGLFVYFGSKSINKAKAKLDNSNADAVQVETFNKLVDRVDKISTELEAEKEKTGYLWGYVIQFLEDYHRRGIRPPEPPKALESDPIIAKFFVRQEKRRTTKKKGTITDK